MNSSAKHIADFVAAFTSTDGSPQSLATALDSLVAGCVGSAFYIETAHICVSEPIAGFRIAFSAYAPKGVVVKQRTMHPLHAAITRVIELAGGKIKLHQPDPDANYQLRLVLDGVGMTNLTRILFNAGRSRDLVEIKGSDYRDIVPSNFVLRIGPDRADVIDAIKLRDPELAELLRQLFVLADEHHGKELTHTR